MILLLMPVVVAAQIHLNFTINNHDELKLPDSLIGIKKMVTKKCDKQNKCERVVSEYNRDGLLVCETDYDEKGKLAGRTVYTYNDKMQLLTYEAYDANNRLSDKEVYKYNKMNNLEEFKDFDNKGNVESSLLFSYDEKSGDLMKQVQYDETGSVVFAYTYSEYDHAKHTVKITQTDSYNKVVKVTQKEYMLFE